MTTKRMSVTAEIVEATPACSLKELCELCRVDADWIAALVEHGVVAPSGRAPEEWQFASVSLLRVRKARRLERDLGLNVSGVALALELLDEIEALRTRLQVYEGPRRA